MANNQTHRLVGGHPLFSILGFQVKLDLSWLLLGLLITWTLGAGLFPREYPDLATATYWWMGVAGALGIFFSIVFHELSHSLVARRHGLPIGSITLFIFGGVADLREQPKRARDEFLIAVAGPLASLLLALLFWQAERLAASWGWPAPIEGVLAYMALINVVLAVFNLVPAFPLDGGRMLRAALWGWRGDLRNATRITSEIGAWFGVFLVVLGGVAFISGNFIGGMWYFLIGLFVRGAAKASYQQLVARDILAGKSVRQFMDAKPVTVPPGISLAEFVDDFVYPYHHRLFPVVDGAELLGCVSVDSLRDIPRQEWPTRRVADIMYDYAVDNVVGPDDDGIELLRGMMLPGSGTQRLVVENGRLVGTISLEDLRELIALKLELGSEDR